jgi:large subunit ribosomal protein L15
MTPVNLDRIQQAIDRGLIDPKLPITMKTLRDASVVNKIEDGVKLLARVKVLTTLFLLVTGEGDA